MDQGNTVERKDVRILVVDDLPAARKIVVRLLKIMEYSNVAEASNSAEATSKLQAEPFNLVISDLHLKDGLGTELLAKTRQEAGANTSVPFILVTSDMDKGSFDEAVKAGATSYLLKPFPRDLFEERIQSALGKSD